MNKTSFYLIFQKVFFSFSSSSSPYSPYYKMMKLFLIACVLGVAQCAHLHADLHAVAAHPVALHTGASSQYRSQDVSLTISKS